MRENLTRTRSAWCVVISRKRTLAEIIQTPKDTPNFSWGILRFSLRASNAFPSLPFEWNSPTEAGVFRI
jgi:hypothetical protein